MQKMVSMARSAAEMKKENSPIAVGSRDSYPYGLSITLNSDSLKKLGITDLPDAGDEMHIMAVAKVTSVSQNANEATSSNRVELQITTMAVMPEDESKEKPGEKEGAKEENAEVYGGKSAMRFK